MVFMPKTPVSISAQLRRDVTNGVYSGASLSSSDGVSRRLLVAGFSVSDLEDIGIVDSTQLSQLRSMDDVGSIDLITFQSDPNHLGFVLSDDLITVISNAKDDVSLLTTADWTIFEIMDPDSETPFEGELKPLTNSKGDVYKVPFDELVDYFKHVVNTGELMPNLWNRGDDNMANNINKQPSDDDLSKLLGDGESMDMNIEEKKSMDEIMFDDAEDYYNQQLKREEEARRREQEEIRRREQEVRAKAQREQELRNQQAQQQKQQGGSQSDGVFIPNLKSFDEILRDLNVVANSDIEAYYLDNIQPIAEFADSMNIDASIFNSFDAQGRRDLMIAMNREREKLVNQAISQLKREAMDVEEQVQVESEESNAMIREKYMELYIRPLEEHQDDMRNQLADYEQERENILESGFAEWWENVQNDPQGVYDSIFRPSIVEDAIEDEKERLNQAYSEYRDARQRDMDSVINEFVQNRRNKDFSHLQIDWSEAARLGAQTLSDRVDSSRAQMDSRKMMAEMRRMYDQMEKAAEQRIRNAEANAMMDPQIERPSHTSRQEGTVQQEKPEPKVQAPTVPEATVEKPSRPVQQSPIPPAPEVDDDPAVTDFDDSDFDEVFDEFDDFDDIDDSDDFDEEVFEEDIEPTYDVPEPVINRPRDIYPVNNETDEDDWDSFDDDDLDNNSFDDFDDDNDDFDDFEDFDDFGDDDDWDDDLDDFEVDEKPAKKGLRGLFSKR